MVSSLGGSSAFSAGVGSAIRSLERQFDGSPKCSLHQLQPCMRGGDDLHEILPKLGLLQLVALFGEQFAITDYVVDRRAKFMAQRVKIHPHERAVVSKIAIDKRQQNMSAAADFLQIGEKRSGSASAPSSIRISA